MSAAYYTIDDELLKQNLLDELLIDQILERANHPEHHLWSFNFGELRVDILSRNEWKVEFFVSKNEPFQVSPKNLVLNSDKVTFH